MKPSCNNQKSIIKNTVSQKRLQSVQAKLRNVADAINTASFAKPKMRRLHAVFVRECVEAARRAVNDVKISKPAGIFCPIATHGKRTLSLILPTGKFCVFGQIERGIEPLEIGLKKAASFVAIGMVERKGFRFAAI